MNINYNDSGYIVKYIQSFLKYNFKNDMLVSGIYDEYTHQILMNYIIKGFVSPYPQDILQSHIEELYAPYFTIEKTKDIIKLISKNKGINDDVALVMSTNYILLNSNADYNGWQLIYYNYNEVKERYIIEIIPKKFNNKLPDLSNLMINHFNNLYLDKHIDDNNCIVDNDYSNNDKMLAIYPRVNIGDKIITLIHRYKEEINLKVGLCKEAIKDMNNSEVQILELVGKSVDEPILPGERILCGDSTMSPDIKYYVIEVPKITISDADTSFINNLYIIPLYFIPIPGSQEEFIDSWLADFKDNPWMIHSKLLDHILGTAINYTSNTEDIVYLQELLNTYYNKKIIEVNGIYSEEMRELIFNYQQKKGIKFGLGYFDVETENKLINDIKLIKG